MGEEASVRTVEVRPPNTGQETLGVIQACVLIGLAGALAINSRTADADEKGVLLSYQRLFSELSADDQRVYRSLTEGLLEAEYIREETGKWPEPSALAADGVPPFAPDPLDDARYQWHAEHGPGSVHYLGVPEASGRRTFLLSIVEPKGHLEVDGGEADPEDGTIHHVLPSGQPLHISLWMRDKPVRPGDPLDPPYGNGFIEIVTQRMKMTVKGGAS